MRIYERLSRIYDVGWGSFAEQYVNLIDQLLNEYGVNQARILDVACGTGMLAISLAGRGHIVHGIDLSSDMVALAESRSVSIPNVSFEVQDMTRLVVQDRFDLITCTFDSVNYVLNTDGVEAMFAGITRCLKRSGLFVFDSNTDQLYLSLGNGSQEKEVNGESFVHEWKYDPMTKEVTTTFRFADGSREIHRQRPYNLSELSPALAESGLRVVETWSWFDRRPYDARSPRLFCVAKRSH
jgi:ubiquinone/menaquinone biosynthesis C-methylase UbiE